MFMSRPMLGWLCHHLPTRAAGRTISRMKRRYWQFAMWPCAAMHGVEWWADVKWVSACVCAWVCIQMTVSTRAVWRTDVGKNFIPTHPPPAQKKIRYNDNQTVIKFVMLAAVSRWASIFYSWADLSVGGKLFSKFFCLCLKTGLLFLLTDVKNGTETNYYLWCTA